MQHVDHAQRRRPNQYHFHCLAADRMDRSDGGAITDVGDAARWCPSGRTPPKTTSPTLPRSTTRPWPVGRWPPCSTSFTRTTRWWPAGAKPPTIPLPGRCTSFTRIPKRPRHRRKRKTTAEPPEEPTLQIASLESKIKTLTEKLEAAPAQIEQVHFILHRYFEAKNEHEKHGLQTTTADLPLTATVHEKALDLLASSTLSVCTSGTRTPPTIGSPTSSVQAHSRANLTGALHPFFVIHHNTVTPYNPQDFRERVTATPKLSSKPRIPAEILHLLDRAMSDLRDLNLDSDSFHQAAKEALEDIYEVQAVLLEVSGRSL